MVYAFMQNEMLQHTAKQDGKTAPMGSEKTDPRLLPAADAAVNSDVPFIPLARPLRWSLVTNRLRQYQANSRAWHPLNRLRTDTN